MSNFYLNIIAEREYLKDSAMEKERMVSKPDCRRPGKRSRHPESAVTAPQPKIGKRTDGAKPDCHGLVNDKVNRLSGMFRKPGSPFHKNENNNLRPG